MADFTIATKVAIPDQMKSISGVLGVAGQAQALRSASQEFEKNKILLGERQAVQKLFSTPETFSGPDGNFDYNKLITEGMKVAPTSFPSMIPQIIQAQKSSLDAQQALNTLTAEQRNQVGQFVLSLGGVKPEDARERLEGLVKTNPQLRPAVDHAWNYALGPAAGNADAWRQAVLTVGQAAMPAASQVQAMTPGGPTVNTGQTTQMVNTAPMAGPVGQPVPGTQANMAVPPSGLETIETDAAGAKHVVSRSPSGAVLSTRPLPGSGQSGAGGSQPGGFFNPAPGQQADLPIVTKERADTNAAAAQVPTQRFNNDQIIKLSTNDLLNSSGPAAQTISQLLGAVGVPLSSDYATNVQNLGHYLALQTQSNAQAMGASTDKAREIGEAVAGSIKMTPDALKNIAKVNNAFATGLENYNKGMESAIRNAGGNVLAAREFKNKWSAAFDPDVYRYANALQSGDKGEIDAVLGKDGSPQRAKKARELAMKSGRLYQLSTTGQ